LQFRLMLGAVGPIRREPPLSKLLSRRNSGRAFLMVEFH